MQEERLQEVEAVTCLLQRRAPGAFERPTLH